ncbi:MAG: hypothetical protein AB8F95_14890, partial [Bacteroidia bacterium]
MNRISTAFVFLAGILMMLTSGACTEKPLPPVITEDPVFTATGTLGGQQINLEAGNDGYFLQTGFNQNEEGVYQLQSFLENEAGDGLRITLRDNEIKNTGESIDPAISIENGAYAYRYSDSVLTGYQANFKTDAAAGSTVRWQLDNRSDATGKEVSRFYPLGAVDSFTIFMQAQTNLNCQSALAERVQIPKPECFTDFTYQVSPLSGRTIEFEAVTSLPRNEFLWSFNGVVQTASRRTSYAFASRGVFRACVEQSGCKTKRCQNIAAGNAVGCPINFNYTTTPVFRLDTLDLGTVTVEWIQDGILYSSRTKSQGEEGRFVISNREPYEKNAAGEA